ncbi:MAG: S9 family peptidase [Candidatus Bathyarchaeia archaeon]
MAKRRPVEIKDLFGVVAVSDPQISPDGGRVAFVRTTMDYEKDEYLSDIWLADDGEIRQFTSGRAKDKEPRWSPDGRKLLFTSMPPAKEEEKKKRQLYVIVADGGEARKLTDLKMGVESPRWSPDGKRILFISPTQPEEPKEDVKRITRLSYRFNARGYYPGVYKHVFSVPSRGGKPRQETKGEFDVDSAEWLGQSIIFVSNTEPDTDRDGYNHIYRLDSGSEPRRLTDGTWEITSITASPDGGKIAFAGHDYRREGATKSDVWAMPADGGVPDKLTGCLDEGLGVGLSCDIRVSSPDPTPLWHRDGHIYFTTNFGGSSYLNRVRATGSKMERLLGGVDKSVEAWSVSEMGNIAYTTLGVTSPPELWLRTKGKETQLTNINKRWRGSLDLHPHERFEFVSSGGHNVEGWIMKPTGYRKDQRYPMAVEIHGGPRGVFGNALMHEHQLLAGRGYAVMYVNPWGSGGYTEDYQAGLPGHYGEQDYADIMEAVDYCLRTYQWVDPNRLACLGGSYGGYMTNWIITHTDRFRAAVTMRSISNWVSFFGTSDIGWTFGRREMLGLPWEDEEAFMSKSPIRYVRNVKTPTLIIHSEEDYRCPIEQGEQLFTALKYLGVPTEMIRFPGENHELSRSGKPKHREMRLEHILRWFEKYL